MGSGGLILLVPILVYLFGFDIKLALISSLFIIGSLALFRTIAFTKQKLIDWKLVALFGLPSILGTYLGTLISTYNSGRMQLFFYALLILIGSILLMRKRDYINIHHEKHYWQVVIDGVVIGVITSFVGVGGGFLIVPALILMGGLELKNAIATSLIIITLKSFFGFYRYLIEIQQQKIIMDWQPVSIFIIVGVVSLFIWRHFNHYFNQPLLKKLFSLVLMLTALSILLFEFSNVLQLFNS
jgi:uncharacterized membrane protein YfcA